MAIGIGILITERISVAAVENHTVIGTLKGRPQQGDEGEPDALRGVPAETVVQWIAELVQQLELPAKPSFAGLGMPGIIRGGIVEDSPNLVQFKGSNMQGLVSDALQKVYGSIPVSVFNDADVMAAGIAATRGHLDRLIRVWTLGTGIGYGRYPFLDGIWEAGHMVVSLDPKEGYCGCGGKGHLEGIMGHRAMRLRFMDLEPEEVFEHAADGDQRCGDFVKLWHRALAAGTANSIHLDGPGKFFVTGFNSRFLNVTLLNEYLHEMVKLSPLQGYSIEIVPGGESVATIGSAVNASLVASRA
jgi:predicted NBD/HSP70 family sugar kinase